MFTNFPYGFDYQEMHFICRRKQMSRKVCAVSKAEFLFKSRPFHVDGYISNSEVTFGYKQLTVWDAVVNREVNID